MTDTTERDAERERFEDVLIDFAKAWRRAEDQDSRNTNGVLGAAVIHYEPYERRLRAALLSPPPVVDDAWWAEYRRLLDVALAAERRWARGDDADPDAAIEALDAHIRTGVREGTEAT